MARWNETFKLRESWRRIIAVCEGLAKQYNESHVPKRQKIYRQEIYVIQENAGEGADIMKSGMFIAYGLHATQILCPYEHSMARLP